MISIRKFLHLLAALAVFQGGAAHADPLDVPQMPLHPDVKRVIGSNQSKAPGDEKAFRTRIGTKSALAEKLLRCASRAERTDPSFRPPLKTCAAWQSGAAVRVGDVRTNAGAYYLSLSNGTTGATAPVHANGAGVSDGVVQWAFVGGTGVVSDDPNAPTVTSSNATPSAPLTCWWNPTTFPDKYRVFGGYPTYSANTWIRPYAFQYKEDGTRGSYGTAISFWTDAPKFAILLNSNGTVRFTIDGQYLTFDNYNPYVQLNNDQGWVTLDFGKVRKNRLIRIESNIPSGPYFGGIRTDSMSSVWLDTTESVKAAWVIDSLGAGSSYGPFLSGGTLPALIGKALGWEDSRNCSRGGTGWLNRGPEGNDYIYRERLPEILAWKPDVINFFGSTNDLLSATPSQIAAEVTASLTLIRQSSDCLVNIFGIWPINNANVATFETAMRGAVTAFNDPRGRVNFISLTNPGDKFPIFSANWSNAGQDPTNSPLNFSESRELFIGNDRLHPTDIGTRTLGNRFTGILRNFINTMD